jgi:pyruvate dehydrogenase E2 component (dihydrolipoamide acetyltransferase)
MVISVTMPALSPTMTEGKVALWHKAVGDAVAPGDLLAEIETDKAIMEIEAVDEGTLGKILVAEGTKEVPVNSVIAMILENGEGQDALELLALEQAPPSPMPEPTKVTAPTSPLPVAYSPVAETPALSAPPSASPPGGRIVASPLARRMAKDAGVNLSTIQGSGPGGRIIKRDVEGLSATAPVSAAAPAAFLERSVVEILHSGVRKIVAKRLTESWQTIPHIFLNIECELDALLETRSRLNERADGAYKISINDFIIRAAAFALAKVPALNVRWTDTAMQQLSSIDIAVAVAMDDGLITPIIREADQKGLAEISVEMKDLGTRGREGKLMPEEYQGGSFTISNLGMFGIKSFGAIINPPQVAIMAVGAGQKHAVVRDGALIIATVMACTLSCDHRAVDGAVGATFLKAFKGFIEEPLTMML